MSAISRSHFPKPRVSNSHFFLSLSRGERVRSLSLRPGLLYCLFALLPLLCTWYLGATLYLIFRDDMLASLMKRQAEMQYAYEDRLAAMRSHLDRVSSRQLLDQDSFEGKVHELLSRQAQLEARSGVVTALANYAGVGRDTTGSIGRIGADLSPKGAARALPLPNAVGPQAGRGLQQVAPALTSFAPLTPDDGTGARSDASDALPVGQRLAGLSGSLDQIDLSQVQALGAIEFRAKDAAQRLRSVIADTGLSLDKLTAPAAPKAQAQGGPFVPLKVDANGTPFERAVVRLQTALSNGDKLQRLLPYMPLRRPLPAGAETTSPFGARSDPFLGKLAMHGGQDFRFDYGAPIRVTAAGTVLRAGVVGGYGNLVEVDHGNGLTTRYGHLSAIDVDEGDVLVAGAIVGRLGSTGRSTGPHLHYETRIDGEAVDPQRFLKPGARLFAGQ